MKRIVGLIMCILSYWSSMTPKEQHVLANNHCATKKEESFYKKSLRTIQIGTLVYVGYGLFCFYQEKNNAEMISKLIHQNMLTLDEKFSLATSFGILIAKTMVYKTVAQLIALTLFGSLEDTLSYCTS